MGLWGRYGPALQVVAGIVIIAVAVLLLGAVLSELQVRNVPSGFVIIRPPDEVSALLIAGDTVWTGGKGGVILIDRQNRARIPLTAGAPPFQYVRGIILDDDGSVWIAHDGGLARYDNGSWKVMRGCDGEPLREARSIAHRPGGVVWVGTETAILYYHNGSCAGTISQNQPGLLPADVLFPDGSGSLWIGSSSPAHGGLFRINGTSGTRYDTADGLPHPVIRDIAGTRDGSIWVATGFSNKGGAAVFSRGSWHAYTTADGLAGPSTRSVYEDLTGRIWIGSEYDGVLIRGAGVSRILTMKDGLAGNEVKVVRQDDSGTYWIGTERGLTVIEPGTI